MNLQANFTLYVRYFITALYDFFCIVNELDMKKFAVLFFKHIKTIHLLILQIAKLA